MANSLTDRDIECIRERMEATPPGPWHTMKTLHCHQLVANVVLDESGMLQRVGGAHPLMLLEHEGGRRFIVQARDDVARLLDHAERLELRCLELEAQLLKLKQDRAT